VSVRVCNVSGRVCEGEYVCVRVSMCVYVCVRVSMCVYVYVCVWKQIPSYSVRHELIRYSMLVVSGATKTPSLSRRYSHTSLLRQ
jgi:hypothetical protein